MKFIRSVLLVASLSMAFSPLALDQAYAQAQPRQGSTLDQVRNPGKYGPVPEGSTTHADAENQKQDKPCPGGICTNPPGSPGVCPGGVCPGSGSGGGLFGGRGGGGGGGLRGLLGGGKLGGILGQGMQALLPMLMGGMMGGNKGGSDTGTGTSSQANSGQTSSGQTREEQPPTPTPRPTATPTVTPTATPSPMVTVAAQKTAAPASPTSGASEQRGVATVVPSASNLFPPISIKM